MSQIQTRANIKSLTFSERWPFALTGAIAGFIIGLLISAPHRYAVWFISGVYCVAMLIGIDEWTKYLSGYCPSCSKHLKLKVNQSRGTCSHCKAEFTVEKRDQQHWIKTVSKLS